MRSHGKDDLRGKSEGKGQQEGWSLVVRGRERRLVWTHEVSSGEMRLESSESDIDTEEA